MDAIAELADRQYGVVTRSQVLGLGTTADELRGRVERGLLLPVHPSVLRVGGASANWQQQLMAAVLAGGEGAAVSHRAAAALWKLDGSASSWWR